MSKWNDPAGVSCAYRPSLPPTVVGPLEDGHLVPGGGEPGGGGEPADPGADDHDPRSCRAS